MLNCVAAVLVWRAIAADRRVLVARVEPQEGLSATSVRQGDVTDITVQEGGYGGQEGKGDGRGGEKAL